MTPRLQHRDQRRPNAPGRADAAAAVERIARELVRLAPCRRDPERFHVDKAQLAAELRAVAVDLRRVAP